LATKAASSDPKTIGAAPLTKVAARSKAKVPAPSRVEPPVATPPAAIVEPAPVPVAAAPAPSKVEAPAPKAAPAPVAVPAATVISAKIDVGFGNSIYIRGEGPGLSWNKGELLDNVGSDAWSISLSGAKHPIVFKLLINDTTWSTGDDFVAEPGSKATVTPTF
jgi:hypothetical protein